jgi:N-formylglutamate amidohydrolase
VERLIDDPMEEYGYGIFYTKDFFGNEVTRDTHNMIFYEKHHEILNIKTNYYLGYFSKVIIVDCHSFGEFPSLYTGKKSYPDFCIGTNKENDLSYKVVEYFTALNYTVSVNDPYKGAIIPSWFIGRPDTESIMIEVNKKLYLNDKYQKNQNFNHLKTIINGALEVIYNYEHPNEN